MPKYLADCFSSTKNIVSKYLTHCPPTDLFANVTHVMTETKPTVKVTQTS